MGSHRKKQYTADFKREAVALVTQHEYAVAAATKNFGVHAELLRRWKTELRQQGAGAFPGKGHQTPDHAKLHRLREKNRRLRIERDMLKKPRPSSRASCDEIRLYSAGTVAVSPDSALSRAGGESEWL